MASAHAFLVFGALLVSGLAAEGAHTADPLGRLFTTPQQRIRLDELRQALPQGEEAITAQLLPEEPGDAAAPEGPAGESITVKGLVTRKGGESTAWVNGSNTFEGDVASQYLRIENKDIHPRGVDIRLPNQEAPVSVKVGETYDPATNQIVDLASPNGPPAQAVPAPAADEPQVESQAPVPAKP